MASVAGVVARTDFQAKLFDSLTAAGVKLESVLRIYYPLEQDDEIECLIVDAERGALTVFADPSGNLVSGPFEGFGPEPED